MTIEINPVESAQHTVKQNSGWYDPRVDINLVREPRRFIHIFTISKRSFLIERPPLHPKVLIPACGLKERWKLAMHVADPFNQAVQNTENGRLRGEAHDGWRVAIDLINPNNITNDPDWNCPDQFQGQISTGYGCDLFRQGVFLSTNTEPTEAELKKAEAKRHAHYEGLRRNATLLEKTNPRELALVVTQDQDYHLMADYFNLETEWHKPFVSYMTCPNCFTKIPEGAAFHVLPGGVYCINDWQKAVTAGIKTKDDVPEELRWWEGQKSSGSQAKK